MKEVMRGASGHDLYFNNEQTSTQLRLFLPDFEEFKEFFLGEYKGRKVSVEDIFKRYVASDEYLWIEKDVRAFLKELENEGLIKVDNRRRSGTFPHDAIIEVLQP